MWPTQDDPFSRSHDSIREDHDDDFEFVLGHEALELLLAMIEDDFERNLDPVVAEAPERGKGAFQVLMRTLNLAEKGEQIAILLSWKKIYMVTGRH